jgi:uncharacterized protein (TIGR00725 family)
MSLTDHKDKNQPIRYSICVSGAAAGPTLETSAALAEILGREIALSGHILTTGATVGLPYHAAVGAQREKGMSIGFSPAASMREHVRKYRLPVDCFDFINYTGLHYVGRDLYLVQSSDAVITVGGRFGSLHEFTSALESRMPCGVLLGSGGTADLIPELLKSLHPPEEDLIIMDNDPQRLVHKIIRKLNEKNKDIHNHLQTHDQEWFLKLGSHTVHKG